MSRLLSATLGRIMPRYRTFADWLVIYRQIIEARPLQPKTLANRYSSLRYLSEAFATRAISAIRPHEIALLLRKSTGKPLVAPSLSARFEEAREGALGKHTGSGLPPSLHECRSLAPASDALKN